MESKIKLKELMADAVHLSKYTVFEKGENRFMLCGIEKYNERKFNYKYNINRGKVAFVYKKKFFVTKATEYNISILEENGFFVDLTMFVPFSNGEIPLSRSIREKLA